MYVARVSRQSSLRRTTEAPICEVMDSGHGSMTCRQCEQLVFWGYRGVNRGMVARQ
jgi:hypothetical protein